MQAHNELSIYGVMSLGFLWCDGTLEQKAKTLTSMITANQWQTEVSAIDPKLRNTVMAILELANIYSVLFKTDVKPASGIFRNILNDPETRNVIRALFMTRTDD